MSLVEGAPNTLSAVDAALKQIYKESNANSLYFDERPAFGLIPKDESMQGRNVPLVAYFGRSGGRSASFASAQTLASSRNKHIEDFLMTAVDDYSLIRMPGKTLAFTRSNEGAFDELVSSMAQKGFDDAENNLANAIELYMYRDGLGWIARINTFATESTSATFAVVLYDPETIYFFELDDVFSVSTDGVKGGALGTSTYKVTSVDTLTPSLGVIRTGGNADMGTSGTSYRYIHPLGDGANDSTSPTYASGVKMAGFAAWIPDTVPTSGDSFLGVDRSQHSRLYGKYMDLSTISRSSAITRASTTLGKEGGAPTVALTHYVQQRVLIEELGLMREYVDMNPMSERGLVANVGYRGVYIQGPHSVLRSVPTLYGFSNEATLIRPEDWTLLSAGPALGLEDYDGLSCLRLPSEDAYEGRMAFRGQLGCFKPGRQGRVLFQSAS